MKNRKQKFLMGIDEAGRGPIAGPVAVGVVRVSREKKRRLLKIFQGVKDSKQHTEKEREVWFEKMRAEKQKGNLDFCVSMSSAKVVDKKGIVAAINESLARGIRKVDGSHESKDDTLILLDGGLSASKKYKNQQTIIKGDEKEVIISLASIAAKVLRDKRMIRYAKKYPGYGFERHKGYGTRFHYEKIEAFGACDIHRCSFLSSVDNIIL